MAFWRQWFLIACALVMSSGPLWAASRESLAYAAAMQDAQDKLWSNAEIKFAQFVKRYPDSTNAPMAVLLEAQAQFQQGKFTEAQELLSDAGNLSQAKGLADQYARWTGEAQFAAGQYEVAAATFARAVKEFPQSPAALGMITSAAAAYEKLGRWAELDSLLEVTNGIFQRTAGLDPDNQQVAGGRLLLARSKFQQNNFPAALAILDQLNPHTLTPDQAGNRAQQLLAVTLAMGNVDGAMAATTNLMQLADPGLHSDGVAQHALLLEKRGLLAEAGTAWADNLSAGTPLDRQREAILKMAELAAAQNNFTNAAAVLDNFLAKFPDSPLAEMALLTAGEMNLKNYVATGATNPAALAPAQARFEQLLGISTNSPLAGKAYLDRGWCEWFSGKYPESAVDFRLAALKALPAPDFAVATFKLGDAQFAQGQYATARDNYRQMLVLFADVPEVMQSLEERALYQILRASLQLRDRVGAETALASLLEKFPTGGDSAAGILLAGEGFSDFSSPKAARDVLQKFEAQFPDSSLKPDVEFALARTFENEQDWTTAIAQHSAWLKNYPTNALLPQVQFALGRANFQASNESAAFGLFTNFVARFPTNDLAPIAQWWVAEHCFRAGEWVRAETNYEAVFQNPSPVWQTNQLALPARLMAGQAAYARQGYKDAVAYFNALIDLLKTNGPSVLGVQARFACGAAYMNLDSTDTNNPLANIQLATNVFFQIVQSYPTNQYGARAWGEIGDCDVLLGDFDAATNAYLQTVSLDPADPSVRGAAQVGYGMALEKKAKLATGDDQKNLLKLALNQYLVLLEPQDSADEYWVKNAGLQAASVAETLGDWTTARAIYGRLRRELPQLADTVDKKLKVTDANLGSSFKKN